MTEVLTVSEVAVYLRVNPQTVYRKAKAGELPAVRIGRAIRFRKSELEEWMKVSVHPSTSPPAQPAPGQAGRTVEDEVKI